MALLVVEEPIVLQSSGGRRQMIGGEEWRTRRWMDGWMVVRFG